MMINMASSRQWTKLTVVGATLCLASLVFASWQRPAEARYLPTRSDESDVEVLKELIKGLMAESSVDQVESRWAASSKPRWQLQQASGSGSRYSHQLERRSMEMPIGSDGDAYLTSPALMIADEPSQQQGSKIKS